jgi:hypothetical protein
MERKFDKKLIAVIGLGIREETYCSYIGLEREFDKKLIAVIVLERNSIKKTHCSYRVGKGIR